MPFDLSAAKETATYVAYVCSEEGAAAARSVLEQAGDTGAGLHGGGLSGAARVNPDANNASIIIAEMDNIPLEMAVECVSELTNSGAQVIVIGTHDDLKTYRALLNAGAAEYFSFPVSAEDIQSVQKRPSNVIELPTPVKPSPSIAVVGSTGGVGASLLAQNLAYHAAALKGGKLRTALLDADMQFGSQAIDLNRASTEGLFEALMAPDRIDQTFTSATMDHLTDKLSMYSHQVGIGQDAVGYERGLPQLMPHLRRAFEAVITDLPRTTLIQNPAILETLDSVVLLIPAGFAGVNAATRLLERITAQAPEIRIIPVLSDLRRDAKLSRRDIVTTIGRDINVHLPRCEAQLTKAQRAAKPVVHIQPRGAYAKSITALWSAAVAEPRNPDGKAKPSLKKRVFG